MAVDFPADEIFCFSSCSLKRRLRESPCDSPPETPVPDLPGVKGAFSPSADNYSTNFKTQSPFVDSAVYFHCYLLKVHKLC